MTPVTTDIFIRPLEPLFFGAPSPFNAGETRFSRSMFPPPPMTFQGMIRSHLLRGATLNQSLDDWSAPARQERAELVGTSHSLPDDWHIKGPFPALLEDGSTVPWLPAPRFLFWKGRGSSPVPGKIYPDGLPHMDDLNNMNSDGSLGQPGQYGMPEMFGYKPVTGWMDAEAIFHVLSGQDGNIKPGQIHEGHPPFLKTNQVQPGIALKRDGNIAEDGMLYRLEHLRFDGCSGFWGRFSGTLDHRLGKDPFSKGLGGAGRKGRLVAFEKTLSPVFQWTALLKGQHLPEGDGNLGLFWLYLLTPAAMVPPERRQQSPLLPGHVRLAMDGLPGRVTLVFSGKDPAVQESAYIRCISAITGPPVTLGGMDIAKGTTRGNQSYIPAGSAWLLEIKGENSRHLKEICNQLNNTHLLGDPDQACFGFGHTLVGIGPEK